MAAGWDFDVRHELVNTFRYGFTKIDTDTIGLRNGEPDTAFRFIDRSSSSETASTNGRAITTNNIVNDLSWLKGNHTLKFGANLRFVRNDSYTFANSFLSAASPTPRGWRASAAAIMPGGACPAPADCCGPAGGGVWRACPRTPTRSSPILGVISQTNVIYNYSIDGGASREVGDPVPACTAPTSTSSTLRTAGA